MSVAGITSSVRTALAAAVTSGGLACTTYDAWQPQQALAAALGSARWELRDSYDQAYGIAAITIDVLVYQTIGPQPAASVAYLESAVESVIDGLGNDRTLGGKVATSDVEGDASGAFFRTAAGQTYSVVSIPVRVVPFANRGD